MDYLALDLDEYTLQAFRNALALGKLYEDNKNEGLTLSTVHTMKGLEKDIVFLIGMCEGVFPDYRATKEKDIAEEKNLSPTFKNAKEAISWLNGSKNEGPFS